MKLSKNESRQRRKIRIRKKVNGTADRPRLVVYRSNMHIYAQIVNDIEGATLVSASTLQLAKTEAGVHCNLEGATKVGKEIARLAKEKKYQPGGVRSQRLPLPRPRESRGRRRPRRRPGVLICVKIPKPR